MTMTKKFTVRTIWALALVTVTVTASLIEAQQPEKCCFTNRRYSGVCTVRPGAGETCDDSLSYLNNLGTTGKAICAGTFIRMGWQSVTCLDTGQGEMGVYASPGTHHIHGAGQAPKVGKPNVGSGSRGEPGVVQPGQPQQAPGASSPEAISPGSAPPSYVSPLIIPSGMTMEVELDQPVDRQLFGEPVAAHLTSDLVSDGAVIAPAGTPVHGVMVQDDPAVAGTEPVFQLTAMTIEEQRRPIVAEGGSGPVGVSIHAEIPVLEKGEIIALGPATPMLPFGEALKLTRDSVLAQRHAIVAANLSLSDEQSVEFWPLYRRYLDDVEETIDTRTMALITAYAESYDSLSDEKAESMLDEVFSIRAQEIKLKQKYVEIFREKLPPSIVTRFFQLDNKLDAVIDAELAKQIPLVR